MKTATILILLTTGCSSHAVSYGRADPEGGAAGAGGLPEVDADAADHIVDAYAPADADEGDDAPQSTEACPGSSACDANGCVACVASACNTRCACFAEVYPATYAGAGSCALGNCLCERYP